MTNVLIVGAGPTGLTTALELTRQGIVPDIVDAKESPSWKSRAVAILPRSIEILNRTGVGDHLIREGVRITRAHIRRGKRSLLDIDLSKLLDKEEQVIALAQNRTEILMSKQLESMGVSVRYDTKVTSVATSETSATVTFADGTTKTYDWVVGADGVFSTVRDSVHISYNGYELDEEWSIADVEVAEEQHHGTINAWLLEGEHKTRDALVMIPIERNRIRLISSTSDSLAALPLTLDVQDIRRTGTFKISVRQAEQYIKGRVILAGDAAHTHSPVGGRGMNLGIEDGQAIADALVHNTVHTYEGKRKPKATRVMRGTEKARKLITSNNLGIVFGIYVVTWCIQHSYFLQKKFAKNLAKL
ncbi:FAD-dependent monooxygenase [Candidatus Kaiserbacteria bacterium]|nr:FAD-dependent monooxygenase [Candidatus Kaiserbacteria bacterium]